MAGPTPYLHFPGTAREALTFYGEVFGCAVQLHTFAEFNRADGPADAIAHGYLGGGPVALFGADVSGDEPPFRSESMMVALLGAAPSTLRTWFSIFGPGGTAVLASWVTSRGNARAAKIQAESSVLGERNSRAREIRRAAYLD